MEDIAALIIIPLYWYIAILKEGTREDNDPYLTYLKAIAYSLTLISFFLYKGIIK